MGLEPLWPPHLHFDARGEVGSAEMPVSEPGAGLVEEMVVVDFGADGNLRPGFMSDPKEAAERAVFGERDVTLKEKFGEGVGLGGLVVGVRGESGSISQEMVSAADLAG